MGTRFMCTMEAPVHENVKKAIVEASETDTELVLRRWKNTSRLFKNKVAVEAVKAERESKEGKFEDVAPYVSGKRGRQVFINGDVDFGVRSRGAKSILLSHANDIIGLDSRSGHWADPRYPHVRGASYKDREGGRRRIETHAVAAGGSW